MFRLSEFGSQVMENNSKSDTRQSAKRHRDGLSVDAGWPVQAARLFLGIPELTVDKVVSVYFPIGSEIDTGPLVEILWQQGQKVCLPVIQGVSQPLLFAEWMQETKLRKGQMGVYEPVDPVFVEPDILVVPLLAFDTQGSRMGYGQGHYDATLSALRQKKDILAIGLAYAQQAVLLALPTEPHDQKLDLLVTEQRIFDFRR